MATNPTLPGAFITTLGGRRCTAVPKAGGGDGGNGNDANLQAATAPPAAATQAAAAQTAANPVIAAEETTSTTSTTISTPEAEEEPTAAAFLAPPPAQFTQARVAAVQDIEAAAPPPAAIVPSEALPPPPPQATVVAETTPAAIPTFQIAAAQAVEPSPSPSPSSSPAPPLASFSSSPSPANSQPEAPPAVPPAAESSQTDNPPVPTFGQASPTPSPLAQSEVTDLSSLVIPEPTDAAAPLTTIGLSPVTPAGDAAAATGTGDGPQISLVPQDPQRVNNGTPAPTLIIVGSVVGGVAVLSIAAFLLWFWRKRVLKKRRSTLLTPLGADPRPFGAGNGAVSSSGEKGNFTIDRGSLGPTPRTEKMRAALGYNFRRIRRNVSDAFSRTGSSGGSVNMNRGTSQFMDGSTIGGMHSRNNSGLSGAPGTKGGMLGSSASSDVTTKDRFMGWWGRRAADVSFNWRVRNDRGGDAADPFASARDMKERNAAMSGSKQPDFLTLLGMEKNEVDREAERRRLSKTKPPGSSGSGSAPGSSSGPSNFLGALQLSFDRDDPFSDANAVRHDSAKVAPLQVSKSDNPFSDANAITAPLATRPPQSNYVANVRRSRGQSVDRNGGSSSNRPGSNGGSGYAPLRLDSVYNRESVNSVDSFQARRNKFRSDPFDLDRPELLSGSGNRQNVTSSNISTAGDSTAPRLSSNTSGSGNATGAGASRERQPRRTRGDSFTSKYSSGISMGDWSDPGPDVGPAATRWDSPTEGWRRDQSPRRGSGGSQSSVGKAL